jgi:hypothetical protein
MVFPRAPHFKRKKSEFEWWGIGLLFPHVIWHGKAYNFIDENRYWVFDAPTQVRFEQNDCWHTFRFSILGFGFWYSKQWSY